MKGRGRYVWPWSGAPAKSSTCVPWGRRDPGRVGTIAALERCAAFPACDPSGHNWPGWPWTAHRACLAAPELLACPVLHRRVDVDPGQRHRRSVLGDLAVFPAPVALNAAGALRCCGGCCWRWDARRRRCCAALATRPFGGRLLRRIFVPGRHRLRTVQQAVKAKEWVARASGRKSDGPSGRWPGCLRAQTQLAQGGARCWVHSAGDWPTFGAPGGAGPQCACWAGPRWAPVAPASTAGSQELAARFVKRI